MLDKLLGIANSPSHLHIKLHSLLFAVVIVTAIWGEDNDVHVAHVMLFYVLLYFCCFFFPLIILCDLVVDMANGRFRGS